MTIQIAEHVSHSYVYVRRLPAGTCTNYAQFWDYTRIAARCVFTSLMSAVQTWLSRTLRRPYVYSSSHHRTHTTYAL